MPTFDIRSYSLSWSIQQRSGTIFLDCAGDQRPDVTVLVNSVEELAAWSALLREGHMSKVTIQAPNPPIIHTAISQL